MPFFSNIWNFVKLHKNRLRCRHGCSRCRDDGFARQPQEGRGCGREDRGEDPERHRNPVYLGKRDPSKGLDCSGTVVWALRELGLEPKKFNATAADLWKQSSLVFIPQIGDLGFYNNPPTHVMVYCGDGKVVGASGGGSSTTTITKAREQGAEVKVLDIDYRHDFKAFGRLPVQEIKDESVGSLNMLGAV